jgi:hypothetical protein
MFDSYDALEVSMVWRWVCLDSGLLLKLRKFSFSGMI